MEKTKGTTHRMKQPVTTMNRIGKTLASIPPYPYQRTTHFPRADEGLFGGRRIGYGNNVPDSKHKTRRRWLPNLQKKSLFSQILNKSLRIETATRVLRTMDKVGGLDNYLLGDKPSRIKELGPKGWELRQLVLQAKANAKQ